MGIRLTQAGIDKIHAEIDHIAKVRKPALDKRAEEARLNRDIPTLKDCIEEQRFLIGRLKHLVKMLENSQLIEGSK